jgi:hypothetical protein
VTKIIILLDRYKECGFEPDEISGQHRTQRLVDFPFQDQGLRLTSLFWEGAKDYSARHRWKVVPRDPEVWIWPSECETIRLNPLERFTRRCQQVKYWCKPSIALSINILFYYRLLLNKGALGIKKISLLTPKAPLFHCPSLSARRGNQRM